MIIYDNITLPSYIIILLYVIYMSRFRRYDCDYFGDLRWDRCRRSYWRQNYYDDRFFPINYSVVPFDIYHHRRFRYGIY